MIREYQHVKNGILQSLLGSLLYIANLMHPADYFFNIMYKFRRDDIDKFYLVCIFLKSYNGVTRYMMSDLFLK